MKDKKESRISCPTFQKQESIIREITDKINAIEGIVGKAIFAEELQKETDVLLSCPDYKDTTPDCKNCHFIANLRKKTANMIIKAKKLT